MQSQAYRVSKTSADCIGIVLSAEIKQGCVLSEIHEDVSALGRSQVVVP